MTDPPANEPITSSGERRGSPPPGRPSGLRKLLAAILAVVVVGGLGVYGWRWLTAPRPPAFDLSGADPEVTAAVEAARAEVCRAPRSGQAWGRLGMVLLANNLPDHVLTCLAQAERLDPGDPRWPHLQAFFLQGADPDAAVTHLRRAVALCPTTPDAPRLLLADLLLAQGQPDEAEEHFRLLLRTNPSHARAALGLARLAYQRGELAQGLEWLRRSVTNPRTQKSSRALLTAVYQRLGDPAAADRESALVARLPDDPPWPDPFADQLSRVEVGRRARIGQANRLLAQGRIPEAMAALDDLVRRYPDADRAWFLLGTAHVFQKDSVAAERALREALRLKPDAVEALVLLGAVASSRGDERAAVASFRRALELRPNDAEAHYHLGTSLDRLGDRPGAIAAFREALRCQPALAEAHTSLAELLARSGKKEEALLHLRRALQLKPDDPRAAKMLAKWEKSPP